jgi:hypothetical protein
MPITSYNLMDRIDKVFARWDRWAERHSKILGVVCVLLVPLVFLVIYRFTGSLLEASLAVAFLPLVFVMGTALVGFIVAPAIVCMDLLAEKLTRYGLPYWVAFLCVIPLGLLVAVLMIFFVDWSLAVGMQ